MTAPPSELFCEQGHVVGRQALVERALPLNAGDYLVFHMDHAGVKVDAEMPVVLGYTLT